MQGNSYIGQNSSVTTETESNEIHRFELLRNELMELERRVQRSTNQSEIEEVCIILEDAFHNQCDQIY